MSECEDCLQLIKERDLYSDKADELAQAIADHFGGDIGEHSNMNCPWENALLHISPAVIQTTLSGPQCSCGVLIRRYWRYCPNCGRKIDQSE